MIATKNPLFRCPPAGVSTPTDADTWRKTIAFCAPKGSTIHIVCRRYPDGVVRMRLYCVTRNRLQRFDQLVNEALFHELIAKQSYDADKIGYYGWDRTDGIASSGFFWTTDVYSNVALGIVYGLAEVIHGDRNTWTVSHL